MSTEYGRRLRSTARPWARRPCHVVDAASSSFRWRWNVNSVRSLRSVVEQLEPRQLLASVPAGFSLTPLVSGLSAPTAEDIAPDGRIFVAEQTGNVRIVQNGTVLAKPF